MVFKQLKSVETNNNYMTYQIITEVLTNLDAGLEAAEAHGLAVGMLTVAIQADADNWLNVLLNDNTAIPEQAETALLDLFEKTRKELDDGMDEFAFDLLLPEDDAALYEQIEALRCWCEGFLYGVGYTQSSSNWGGELAEIMLDIVELTKIDSDIDENEEDANALMELHEYLRTAVLTVKDNFLETRQDQIH